MPAIRPPGAPRPLLLLLPLLLLASAVGAADDATSPRVRLATSLGDVVVELDAERAPRTVENFLRYVDEGFYDDTLFHRVIDGFMIQGGGFTGDFKRKHTRAPIANEASNGLANRRYTISMARTNAPHSATAQFFINTVDNPNLDHTGRDPRGWGYAVFGRVVDGHEVVERISRVATGPGGPFSRDVPREPVVIVEARRLAPPAADGTPADPTAAEPVPAPAKPHTGDAADEPRGEQTAAGELELSG